MKKYIFTIAFALLGITSSMASKADTLRIYSIDGERIPNFTGKELIGKTIKNYQINTNVFDFRWLVTSAGFPVERNYLAAGSDFRSLVIIIY